MFALSKVQRARELLEDANELMPHDSEVALLLAKASLMAGEPIEALAVLQGMAGADQKNAQRLFVMGQAKALCGDLNAAAGDLQTALNASPGDPECLAAYAWVQNLQGNFDGAITTLTKARAILPKAPWVPYRIAVSYYFQAKYDQAEKKLPGGATIGPQVRDSGTFSSAAASFTSRRLQETEGG